MFIYKPTDIEWMFNNRLYYDSQAIFDCQTKVILIHNNCVLFFPIRKPIMQALPSHMENNLMESSLQFQESRILDIFYRAAYIAFLRRLYYYLDIQKGPPCFFGVCFLVILKVISLFMRFFFFFLLGPSNS